MKLRLVPFGIAREIMDGDGEVKEIKGVRTTGELKTYLNKNYDRLAQLKHFRLAVNEEYRDDDFILSEDDEVIIIPPVSGG